VVDMVPRAWTAEEMAVLTDLAGAAATELELLSEVTERRRAERALQESEERFRNAFDYSAIGMALVAPDGRWLRVNSALCAIVGYSVQEMLRLTFQDITHPDDLEADLDFVRQMLGGELQTYQLEKRYFHKRGHLIWVLLTVSLVRDPTGAPQHFISQIQDITERKRAEEAQARLTAILEATPDIIAVGMHDGRLPYVNAAGRRLLGLGNPQVGNALTVKDLQLRLANGETLETGVRTALREGVWRGETALRKRDGRELPVEQVILAHASPDGTVEYFSTIMRDITERKQVEATLRALSLVDELTGLHNRRGFMTLAQQEWKRARCGGWPLLVFYIDVDDFKRINDSYGHAEGDAALVAVASILRATFREADVIARLGGDEFTVLALHGGGGTVAAVTARLQQRLAEHNASAGRPYALALSVGVAQSAVSALGSLEDLMVQADAALYEEKRARKQEQRRA
nr:PAS domain S-box protein [Chloroflexota bacterium]